jgi:hypothetical protein
MFSRYNTDQLTTTQSNSRCLLEAVLPTAQEEIA